MKPEYCGFARAKINLGLHITGQRADGFHELDSVVVFTAKGDHLRIQESDKNHFSIAGEFAQKLNSHAPNLVTQAVQLVREKCPNSLPMALQIELTKNLPVAAGIGGGSADAAETLNLLANLAEKNGKQLDPKLLAQCAVELGSDVPMCMTPAAKHVRGVGDQFAPILRMPKMHVVLANPNIGLATPHVFSKLDRRENAALPDFGDGWDTLADLVNYLRITRNDLTQPACELVPEIAELTFAMSDLKGCKLARMSGSGATVFGLFDDEEAAKKAGVELSGYFPRYWVQAFEVEKQT